jgi:hypothetical protein
MAYDLIIDTERNIYPNIIVYKTVLNGVQDGWRILPADGYVMYNQNANDMEPVLDENGDLIEDENGNVLERPVTYYFVNVDFPLRYNWNNFAWVAVLRDSVNENYILGVDNNNEVM